MSVFDVLVIMAATLLLFGLLAWIEEWSRRSPGRPLQPDLFDQIAALEPALAAVLLRHPCGYPRFQCRRYWCDSWAVLDREGVLHGQQRCCPLVGDEPLSEPRFIL